MIESVLILCAGNICRSPMAAALLAHAVPHLAVSSAGIIAPGGAPVDPLAIELIHGRGLDIAAHRARRFETWMATQAGLILTMDWAQCDFVRRRCRSMFGRVYRLGDYQNPGGGPSQGYDVPDPYQRGRRAFEDSLRLIERGVTGWARYLATDLAATNANLAGRVDPGINEAEQGKI